MMKNLKPNNLDVKLADGQVMPVLTAGQGKPVVLLHGFGMDAAVWLPFVLLFAERYRFYMPYLRGFGKAAYVTFSKADFLTQYAEDINQLFEQENLTQVKLVGISMGALTALKLNELYGFSKVGSYMHIDQSPVMHNTDSWPWGVMGKDNALFFEKLKDMVALAKPELHKPYKALSTELKVALVRTSAFMFFRSFNSPLKYMATLMAVAPLKMGKMRDTVGWQQQIHIVKGYLENNYDLRISASKLSANVSVVIGGKSKLYNPKGQKAFADMLENCKVSVVKNAGHAVPADAPLAFFKVLKGFLK